MRGAAVRGSGEGGGASGRMHNVVFALLSFEGPDRYSHAGGLGSRATEMSHALATLGLETHLFFVGDPHLPGHEVSNGGKLHLHRWCQWISAHHPGGVYDGEEGKLTDWNVSIPRWLESDLIGQALERGKHVVVIGEEWHTAGTLINIHEILVRRGWQNRVHLLWNANNTFSFHRVDWGRLRKAATCMTVSRYMKHVMWRYSVDARVVPNGISSSWLTLPDARHIKELAALFTGRVALVKLARWDPDKRWDMAVEAVADMKRAGLRPLFIGRGGREPHGKEVLAGAAHQGLTVTHTHIHGGDLPALTAALRPLLGADMIMLETHLTQEQRQGLYHTADAVLANSGIEPFGLVGLEAMACEGIALVGSTGEDYATHGHDAISVQSAIPQEIVRRVAALHRDRAAALTLRAQARLTAALYTWDAVLRRVLLPFLEELGVPIVPDAPPPRAPEPPMDSPNGNGRRPAPMQETPATQR